MLYVARIESVQQIILINDHSYYTEQEKELS